MLFEVLPGEEATIAAYRIQGVLGGIMYAAGEPKKTLKRGLTDPLACFVLNVERELITIA